MEIIGKYCLTYVHKKSKIRKKKVYLQGEPTTHKHLVSMCIDRYMYISEQKGIFIEVFVYVLIYEYM